MPQQDEHKQNPTQDIPRAEETPDTDKNSDGNDTTQESVHTSKRKARFAHLDKKALFFGSLVIIFIVAYCIVNAPGITGFIARIGEIITPLIIGAIIAYLCNPILEFYEYRVFRKMKKGGARRGFSLLCTVLTAIAIIALLLLMIVPKLIESIGDLANNFQSYIDNLLVGVQNIINTLSSEYDLNIDIADVEELKYKITEFFNSGEGIFDKILSFVEKSDLVGTVGSTLATVIDTFKNWILGLFIAFYILSSKEKRVAQIKKFRRAFLTEKQDKRMTEVVSLVDRTFSGYVFGILIDAIVVGIMTFTLLAIFSIAPKYSLLIAVICAATNIIPVFGPFLGAIPSALIVLISDPKNFFLFIFLVLVIQQIDGNLLCPKIQGDNTGVSSLAVLVAITIAGSIGGILGMIIGVPIFAVIIELFKQFLDRKLEEKGYPTDTTAYYPTDALGNAEKDVYYEHASLRYEYEHSEIKPKVDRFRRGFFRHLGRQATDADAPGDAQETNKKKKKQKKGKR